MDAQERRAEGLVRGREQSPPATSAVKSGVHMRAGALMLCGKCVAAGRCEAFEDGAVCVLEREYVQARCEQVRAALEESGQDVALQAPLVTELVFAEVRSERARRYLAVLGELRASKTGGPQYTAVALEQPKLAFAVVRLMDTLGLTASARHRLKASRDNDKGAAIAAVFRQLEAEDAAARERGEPIDGEWREADDEDAAAQDEDTNAIDAPRRADGDGDAQSDEDTPDATQGQLFDADGPLSAGDEEATE